MKKLSIIVLFIYFGCSSLSFAEQKSLTVGETLTRYFTEIFPTLTPQISEVTVNYSGIGTRITLKGALQRGIYYKMLPNSATTLHPDEPMSESAFSELIRRDFGARITTDNSSLTLDEYERFMGTIRSSFSYRILRLMNTSEEALPVQPISPKNTLPQTNNHYLLDNIYTILQNNYLLSEKINQTDLIYGAAEGLVNELGDQHTQFFRPDASTDFKNTLAGNVVGIGVMIDVDAQGYLSVTGVIRHSPAEKAGLVSGDKIIQVDGFPVSTADGIVDDVTRLRGLADTQVMVTVQSGNVVKTISLIRQIIHVEQVESEILPDSYRITFSEVAFGTDVIMQQALKGFLASGKKRLILDLRNNPGGSMAETLSILNYWIDAGNPLIILQYPKVEVVNYAHNAAMTDWNKYEIVMLINAGTASAAEIIAATLREYFPRNTVIIGETSYGKGTVQELVSFDDKSLLKYTIAEWLVPRTRASINKVGIIPDKKVVFDTQYWKTKKIDTQLLAAQQYVFSH